VSGFPAQAVTRLLHRISTDDVSEAPDQVHVRITLAGALLAIIGFAMPWYSAMFTPPGGGIAVDGSYVPAFAQTYDGFNSASTGPGRTLLIAIVGLLFIALYQLAALLGFDKRSKKLIIRVAAKYHATVGDKLMDTVQAIVHVLQAIAYLGLIFLAVSLGKIAVPAEFAGSLGGGATAVQASRYLSIGLGAGFWLMVIGLIVAGAMVARRIAVVLLVLVGVVILLAIAHHQWLGPFLHFLGF
jgi:hypothetical protein